MVRGIDRGGGGIDRGWGGHERSGGESGGGGEAPTSARRARAIRRGRAAARWRAAVTEARREAAAAAAAARTAAPSCLGERSGGRRRRSSLLSAFEPGIPCHCDRRAREQRSRARRHSRRGARAIFAESGPQREAVFSADVQRRARTGAAVHRGALIRDHRRPWTAAVWRPRALARRAALLWNGSFDSLCGPLPCVRGTASGTSSVATDAWRAVARRCWRWWFEVGIVQSKVDESRASAGRLHPFVHEMGNIPPARRSLQVISLMGQKRRKCPKKPQHT